jgi:hypothetical protein
VTRRRHDVALVGLLLAGACAAPERLPDPPKSHPASPQAEAAPERAPSQTLVMQKREAAAATGTAPGRGH